MKYRPTPKKLIIQNVKPSDKIGLLIVPVQKDTHKTGIVKAIGQDFPYPLNIGDYVMFTKFGGLALDEEKGLHILHADEVICIINPEE